MTRMNNTLIALAAALLMSGTAFAAQPAAGEGPFFPADSVASSTLQRAAVQADAIGHAPLAGNLAAQDVQQPSALSRAEVRAQTREALDLGWKVQTGNFS